MIGMSWEDIIKNVRDTPIGDMEEAERNAERIRREMESKDYDGNERATRIASKMAMKELERLRGKLSKIIDMCDDIIKETKANPEKMDARYVEMAMRSIRSEAVYDYGFKDAGK